MKLRAENVLLLNCRRKPQAVFALPDDDPRVFALHMKAVNIVEQGIVGDLVEQYAVLDLKIGDFAKLPWDDEQFDIVIDIEDLSFGSITDI